MTILRKLKDYLEQNQVSYEVGYHSRVYTAQEIAAAQDVPGKEMAKVVMVNEFIVFQAGSHVETLRIKYTDYSRLVNPKVADFSVHL